MDDELRQYLDRLRQENMKAHMETWRQIAALEKRIDAVVADNASAHSETRLHIDETVERLEQQLQPSAADPRTNSSTEVHFRRDG
ncbi:MAG TPA: hypothetical protein VG323_12560 [Thermoanaerobaculia bacterium]|nr:hypothetical protein [Thermoanaerobaculia bacterium]